jgi:Kef-type K+ transport system membrane component KefB
VYNIDLIANLIIQLIFILAVCKLVVYIGKCLFGQSQVVCEMIAGVILGPSLLGFLTPNFQQWLFPSHIYMLINEVNLPNPSMSIIHVLGQFGLIFYMFIIGLEFDINLLKHKLNGISVIVCASIFVPMILGITITYMFYDTAGLFEPTINFSIAASFLGISMAMTAFPMLARIIQERGLTKTPIGILSLASGAICDAISWSLMAFLLAILKKNKFFGFISTIGFITYFTVMIFFIKKTLTFFISKYEINSDVGSIFIYIIIYVLFSAYITNYIGIYPIFGAFIAGTIIPSQSKISIEIKEKMETMIVKIFLPLFFVYSGLNTQIQLINTETLWTILVIIVLIAIIGKLLACSIAAKISGENWHNSMTIGALMNSRGLMELIILNIGLEYKIITPVMFSILTIMAIITTLMTSPIINFLEKRQLRKRVSQVTVIVHVPPPND